MAFFTLPGPGGTRLELLPDRVQESVDESRRFFVAVLLGDFDGLVDDDRRGQDFFLEELVDGHPEDVPVDKPHPLHAPVFGRIFDQPVDVRLPIQDAVDEPTRVIPDLGFGLFAGPVFVKAPFDVGAVELELEQDLEGALPGLPPLPHGYGLSLRSLSGARPPGAD